MRDVTIREPVLVWDKEMNSDRFDEYGLDVTFDGDEVTLVEVCGRPSALAVLSREQAIHLAKEIFKEYPLDALSQS